MLTYYVRRASPMAWFDNDWISGLSGGSRLPIDLHEDADAFELVAAVPGLADADPGAGDRGVHLAGARQRDAVRLGLGHSPRA